MILSPILTLLQIALALANVVLAINLTIQLRRVKQLETALLRALPRIRRRLRLRVPAAALAVPSPQTEPGTDPTIGFRDPYR